LVIKKEGGDKMNIKGIAMSVEEMNRNDMIEFDIIWRD